MAAGKTVVVDVTCKDAEDFRAQQAALGVKGAPLSQCPIKEVRIVRADDGVFWVQAVEGTSGLDLTCLSMTLRDAYAGVLVALWLWHYGPIPGEFYRPRRWGSRLMRWVAVVSRWVCHAPPSRSLLRRFRRAEP